MLGLRQTVILLCLSITTLIGVPPSVWAQEGGGGTLRVEVKVSEAFVIEGEEGRSGIAATPQNRVSSGFARAVTMLEARFDVGAHGFALPPGSELQEPLNRAMLSLTRDPDRDATVSRSLDGGG